MKNEPMWREEAKEVAQKICRLTEFGQPLHPNDILPDIKELVSAQLTSLGQAMVDCLPNARELPPGDTSTTDLVQSAKYGIDVGFNHALERTKTAITAEFSKRGINLK